MRFMVIENGVATNAILAENENAVPGLTLVQSDTANIGDLWDEQVFTAPPPPPPPVPQEITMRQARLVLLGAGLLNGVQTAIDGLPEPQRSAANIEWEFSNTLQRRNAFVLTLGPALGLNDAQIDALFIQGSTL